MCLWLWWARCYCIKHSSSQCVDNATSSLLFLRSTGAMSGPSSVLGWGDLEKSGLGPHPGVSQCWCDSFRNIGQSDFEIFNGEARTRSGESSPPADPQNGVDASVCWIPKIPHAEGAVHRGRGVVSSISFSIHLPYFWKDAFLSEEQGLGRSNPVCRISMLQGPLW